MTSPCTKDCPNRMIECHTTCEKYIEFVAKVKKAREKRDREKIGADYIKDQIDRMERRRFQQRKH